jgi:hypothetical protein
MPTGLLENAGGTAAPHSQSCELSLSKIGKLRRCPVGFLDLGRNSSLIRAARSLLLMRNDPTLRLAGGFASVRMRDTEVEQQVLRSLKLDSAIEGREVCVESQDGVVTLSGTAPSYHQRSAVHEATLRAPGVRGVVNQIEVEVDGFFIADLPPSANTLAPPLNLIASP